MPTFISWFGGNFHVISDFKLVARSFSPIDPPCFPAMETCGRRIQFHLARALLHLSQLASLIPLIETNDGFEEPPPRRSGRGLVTWVPLGTIIPHMKDLPPAWYSTQNLPFEHFILLHHLEEETLIAAPFQLAAILLYLQNLPILFQPHVLRNDFGSSHHIG